MEDHLANVLKLVEIIDYSANAVVSKTLLKKEHGTMTLFAFDKDQELSPHTSPYDAVVYILDGTADILIDKRKHRLNNGEMIIMPANIPHAVYAYGKFKMMLFMVKD